MLRGQPRGCCQIEDDKEAKVKKHVQWKIEVRIMPGRRRSCCCSLLLLLLLLLALLRAVLRAA